MRTLPFLALATLALSLVPLAAADHPGNCPEYTNRYGAASVEVAHNHKGQFLFTAEGYYMAWDYTVFWTGTDSLFSWWFYQETNGRDGLQRNDEFCNNSHPGEETDGGCFC